MLKKRALRLNAENSFEAVVREWHAKYVPTWPTVHGARLLRRLDLDATSWFGGLPAIEPVPADVLLVGRLGAVKLPAVCASSAATRCIARDGMSKQGDHCRLAWNAFGGIKVASCSSDRACEGGRVVEGNRRLFRHRTRFQRVATGSAATPTARRTAKCRMGENRSR